MINFIPVVKDISRIRGDTIAFTVDLSDVEATVVSMFFSVKKSYTDTEYVFQKALNSGITDLGDGSFAVRIAPEDTANLPVGRYRYDLQLGLGSDILTLMIGNLILLPDVTREVE